MSGTATSDILRTYAKSLAKSVREMSREEEEEEVVGFCGLEPASV